MLRILHTGDLHLASPFSSLSPEEQKHAQTRQMDALFQMAEYASVEEVDLFLIAGDLFDGNFVSGELFSRLSEILTRLPCPVVIAPGNHDPYTLSSPYRKLEQSDNLFIFSGDRLSSFSFPDLGSENEGVTVYGYAFVSDALPCSPLAGAELTAPKEGLFSLLLAHGERNAPLSKYAPIADSDLLRLGFDYAALGHIHNPKEEENGGPIARYCGFPCGRSFDELGEGGCLLVTLEKRAEKTQIQIERKITTAHRYLVSECELGGVSTEAEAGERIASFLRKMDYGKETALKLYCTGETAPSFSFDTEQLLRRLGNEQNFPSVLRLVNRTLPIYGTEYLEQDLSIRGEVYRILKEEMLSGSAEEREAAADAFRYALAALDGRPI